jgi:UDPglucose 6-dehydrogenase
MRSMCVIGAGYAGLVTAACFAELGHRVTLLEMDPERPSTLEQGVLP